MRKAWAASIRRTKKHGCLFFVFLYAVPDTAPTDVGGGGGSKSELVITWEVSHLSILSLPLCEVIVLAN